MSVDNFIKTVWSAKLIKTLEKVHVFANTANRSYEGEIKDKGDTVKINQIGPVTIGTYTKNSTSISPETLNDASTILQITESPYFAFEVDDVDAALGAKGLIPQGLEKAAYGLRDTVDAYMAALYATCGLSHPSYTDSSPVDMTALNVEEVFGECGEVMSENNVQKENRFAIIPPWVHTKAWLAGIASLTDNPDVWKNGYVGMLAGFKLYVSNNVSKNSTSWDKSRIIMGIEKESFAYAEATSKVEAYRPQSSFSDAVKGLLLYGAKIIRPDMTLVLYADKTAEPS